MSLKGFKDAIGPLSLPTMKLARPGIRPWRIIAAALLLYVFFYVSWGGGLGHGYAVTTSALGVSGHRGVMLDVPAAEDLCKASDLKVYEKRDRYRKIYDLFLVDNELDWTEIRINELAAEVDYFVIVESTRTFTNKPKPLHFRTNFKRFAAFQDKIIYHLLDNGDTLENNSTWDREHFQRNSMMDAVFPSLIGDKAPHLGDVILVSDVDEIPRPSTLRTLRNCQFNERTTIYSHFFYYSFQWEHPNFEWHHPQATFWQGFSNTIKPEDLRMGPGGTNLKNAAWHCTWCFNTMADFTHKITSWSHTEYNQEKFRIPEEIVRRVRHGIDLFDREGQNLVRLNQTSHDLDMPDFVRKHPERFAHMIDRDPDDANLIDYVD